MKQLTKAEIQELFDLFKSHAIEYYDVQLEILDHYATSIEEIWETEPTLSFNDAKNRVYKEFWDFKDLEKTKRKILEKKYEKEFLTEIKSWFTLPKILLYILFGIVIFELLKQVDSAAYYLVNFIFYTSLFSIFYDVYLRVTIESAFKTKFLQLDSNGGILWIAATFGILSIQWANSLLTFYLGILIAVFFPIWIITMIFGHIQQNETVKNIHLNFKSIK